MTESAAPSDAKPATARAAFLALRARARTEGRLTDELLLLYVLEGFLRRLAFSRYSQRFVLKGGVLLAALGDRRPTKDIDFQGRQVANTAAALEPVVREIASLGLNDGIDDGVTFDVASLSCDVIREDDGYQALRLRMKASVHTSRHRLALDVSVGDPISPAPASVLLPSLLDNAAPVELIGYRLETVHAEKLVTALARGTTSTRWRDLADVWTLSRHHECSGADLEQALRAVAEFRRVDLQPLLPALADYPNVAQSRWGIWRRNASLTTVPPELIADVLRDLDAFSRAPLSGQAAALRWHPGTSRWLR